MILGDALGRPPEAALEEAEQVRPADAVSSAARVIAQPRRRRASRSAAIASGVLVRRAVRLRQGGSPGLRGSLSSAPGPQLSAFAPAFTESAAVFTVALVFARTRRRPVATAFPLTPRPWLGCRCCP